MTSDFSEEIRLPAACSECGSHLYRVSKSQNPADRVYCASCKRFLCLYHEAQSLLQQEPGDEHEALLEELVNRNHR